MPNTAARPSASASMAPLRSLLPVSTPTTRCTGRVWFPRASVTRGIHAAPSWATMTAVTTCWFCAFVSDKSPLAARSGHLPDAPGDSPPASGTAGAPREQYAKPWQRGRQTARPQPGGKQRTTCPGPPGASPGGRRRPHRRRGTGRPRRRSAGLALEPTPFPFRQPAPDPEPLVVLERVFQALGANLTAAAHLLGFPGRAALLGEERLRIGLCTQRIVLPVHAPGIVLADTKYAERDDLSHGAPPTLPTPSGTRRTLPSARELHK